MDGETGEVLQQRWKRRPFLCKWLAIHSHFTPTGYAPAGSWITCFHCGYKWVG